MKTTNRTNKILAAAVIGMGIASASGAFAASEQAAVGSARLIHAASEPALDYRLELVSRPRLVGGIGKLHQADSESVVLVRLVRPSDGTLVTDANVTLSRVDMSPGGMSRMTARSYIRPARDPGTYWVEIHPTVAAQWAVTVAARVADRSEPVQRTLTVALAK